MRTIRLQLGMTAVALALWGGLFVPPLPAVGQVSTSTSLAEDPALTSRGPTLIAAAGPDGDTGRGSESQQGSWNIEPVSQFGGATYVVAVKGTYAYISVGPRLVILVC